jgi:hypothetical protein
VLFAVQETPREEEVGSPGAFPQLNRQCFPETTMFSFGNIRAPEKLIPLAMMSHSH